jgi:hypothetical protein
MSMETHVFFRGDQGTVWYASNDIDERIKSIYDRAPPYEREKRQMTDADRFARLPSRISATSTNFGSVLTSICKGKASAC